jgi:hypothetical protein
MEAVLECPICSDEISIDKYVAQCKHEFCLKCILQWINTEKRIYKAENTCPLCRSVIDETEIRNQKPIPIPNPDPNIIKINPDLELDFDTFLKIEGVYLDNNINHIMLNCKKADSWLDLYKINMKITSAKMQAPFKNEISRFTPSFLKIFNKPIIFETDFMNVYYKDFADKNNKFYMSENGPKYFLAKVDETNSNIFENLDNIYREHFANLNLKYESLIKTRISELKKSEIRNIKFKLDDNSKIFLNIGDTGVESINDFSAYLNKTKNHYNLQCRFQAKLTFFQIHAHEHKNKIFSSFKIMNVEIKEIKERKKLIMKFSNDEKF